MKSFTGRSDELNIPAPAASRLARLTVILDNLDREGRTILSSSQLSTLSGYPAHTIRKDISYLGNPGLNGAGYETALLRDFIRFELNLEKPVRACIAGLGKLGSSILSYQGFLTQGIEIVAGFDSSINKIEQFATEAQLFPSYEIEEQASRLKLELGIIAVPQQEAQKTANRMIAGGITGILNFAPATLEVPESIKVKNLYVAEELMVLATQIRSK